MTTPDYTNPASSPAWQRYLNREHAARDAYLTAVQHAHREYLTGPFPDREAYNVVEGDAWRRYYAAGREAWRTYADEASPPPPPPYRHHMGELGLPTDYREQASGNGWTHSPVFIPTDESRS